MVDVKHDTIIIVTKMLLYYRSYIILVFILGRLRVILVTEKKILSSNEVILYKDVILIKNNAI